MSVLPAQPPVPYSPDDEEIGDDEQKTIDKLTEVMTSIQEKTYKDGFPPLRSVHAKSYALFEGELTVDRDLPDAYAQGLFAEPGRTYRCVLRLSAIPGDILPDEITAPRGLSIKLLDVPGERLPGSEGDTTQDFILINGDRFLAPNPKAFLQNLSLLAATTDKVEGLKKVMSATSRALEKALETFGGESVMLQAMGGAPMVHPMGDTFYSQAPLLWGDYVAKVAVAPASDNLIALTDEPVDIKGRDDGFRELAADVVAREGGEWDFRVQLRTNRDTMPIEDPSKQWDQDESPYVPVGRIRVKPQPGWTEARSKAVDDAMFFSVWHGVAAHRPLGGVMRARKDTYVAAHKFRSDRNGCPMREPRNFEGLPG